MIDVPSYSRHYALHRPAAVVGPTAGAIYVNGAWQSPVHCTAAMLTTDR